MKETYFVVSYTDEPVKIFFTKEDAFSSDYSFIDSFDETGEHVQAYKWVDGVYTTNF